jgi:hypothetical protein
MDDNGTIWNFHDSGAPSGDAPPPPFEPPTEPAGGAVTIHDDQVAHAIQASRDTIVSLHPDLGLVIGESLHGDAGSANNLCILIGTVTREYRRNRQDRGKGAVPRAEGEARTVRTALGTTESLLRLEVQEVLSDGVGAALAHYSMPLNVSAKLAATDVFTDGQRIAIGGPLRMERTYDVRFAAGDLDLGLPAWTLRLDVISMQALTDDSDMPDGSWVQLEGEIEDDAMVRFRPIGPMAAAPFASVRLRCRQPLRGGFAGSRAQFQSSVIVPLEISLDGGVAQVGALLKRGNRVRIEGRLAPYQVRRNPEAPTRASTRQRETAALLQDALARTETRLRAEGGDDRRVRAAKQRLLTSTQLTVSVGYVELRHGTELTDAQIAELIASRPRRARPSRQGDHTTEGELDRAVVTAALDAATNAKLGLGGSDLLAVEASGGAPLDENAATVKSVRPRRRARELTIADGNLRPRPEPGDEDGRADDA